MGNALIYKTSVREEKSILNREFFAWHYIVFILDVPFVGRESVDEEQDNIDKNVGNNDPDPELWGQRSHEGEHSLFSTSIIEILFFLITKKNNEQHYRFNLLRLVNHHRDAKIHERLSEIHHFLSRCSDSECRYR